MDRRIRETTGARELPGEPANRRFHLVQAAPVARNIGAEARGLITSGEGTYVVDENGRQLIDGPAGMWCINVGHRNEILANVMRDQAMALTYSTPWYTSNEPAETLAEMLSARAPGDLRHVFFTTGGSSAVETAIRLMQFYNNVRGKPQKKLLISRQGSYHGSTHLTASLNGRPRDHDWMDGVDLVRKLSSPSVFHGAQGLSVEAFEDHLVDEFRRLIEQEGADRIGAFIAEPIQASGGVLVSPANYLKRMHALCRQNDILYISDEVVTAFGRLGHIFASEDVFGIQPDMITFAKGVTSGYFPLGGVMVSARIFDELRKSDHPNATFVHGLTYSSHPIGCAVAIRNIELLEDGLLEHAREVSPYFQHRLKTLEDLPLVGEVRGMGLMAGVECVADPSAKNPLNLDLAVGKRIDFHCQQKGLLVRPLINMCVMSPPLIITRTQIDTMVAVLREGIASTANDLINEGLWRQP
ncbi:aminotransferase [Mesorhizobium sp. VK24D]|uniref:Aminotransferase n=1 Tax=Mesorhizobium album TaxID=3072314 RepID=A0ABU4Y268_9HYPH|nr:aminotransferase [Mesorhizobium sp. VK24D]MDX8480170.1 aminotransferase [Mesorhizobium sp. VK24D]